jgi:hypothetical protein
MPDWNHTSEGATVTNQPALSPAEAADLLGAADAATERGDAVGRRARLGTALSVAIGCLVGAFLLAGVYVLPNTTWQGAAAVSGAYLVGIVASTTLYTVFRRVTPTGWLRRFHRGLTVTVGVFLVALALSFLVPERSLLLWIPLAVLAALPVTILGGRRVSR